MKSFIVNISVFVFCFTFNGLSIYSQSLDRNVSSSAGKSVSSASVFLDYNVGEIITTTGYCSDAILTQGFEQPSGGTQANQSFVSENIMIYVFPNPTDGILTVEIGEATSISDLHFEVYDFMGKELSIYVKPFENTFQIDLINFNSGVYFFKVSSSKFLLVENYRIIKL